VLIISGSIPADGGVDQPAFPCMLHMPQADLTSNHRLAAI
jgi:hypothetical protein